MNPATATCILLIEDVAATAEIVEAYVRAESASIGVVRVETLGAALEKLAKGAFDLIIADLNLPDSSGLDTLDRLAQSTDRLIIVLTIENDPGLEEMAIARGAYDFLHKSQLSRASLGRIVRLATMQANTFRSLRDSEARFRNLIELSSDWYWEQDAALRFVGTAGQTEARGGISAQAHIGKLRWELPNTEIINQTWDEHRAVLAARQPFRDLLLRRRDVRGEAHYVAVAGKPIFDAQGTFRGYHGVASDVTARLRAEEALQRANAQLEQLALHDPLTGLANRRKLAERFQYDLARSVRTRSPLSLLMVDIDDFKAINDKHGHVAGDACLKALAAILTESVRAVDLVVRYGGEEFVVLLPEMSADQSLAAAERLRSQVEAQPVCIGENVPPLAITVSVGAATTDGAALGQEDLIARADQAVYQAKRAGRNQVRGYSPGEP